MHKAARFLSHFGTGRRRCLPGEPHHPIGSSGHGAWLVQTHERHRLIWHKFSCAITPTGMPSSLFWPKDLAEPGPHGEVRVPQSPLLSSRHLQHHSPTLTTHLSLTLPSSSSYAWHKEGKNAATAKTGREHWELFLAPAALLLIPGQLPALPDDKQSRPLFSFILGSSPFRNTGTVRAGFGSRSWLQDCSKPWILHSRVALEDCTFDPVRGRTNVQTPPQGLGFQG